MPTEGVLAKVQTTKKFLQYVLLRSEVNGNGTNTRVVLLTGEAGHGNFATNGTHYGKNLDCGREECFICPTTGASLWEEGCI